MSDDVAALKRRIDELEREVSRLRSGVFQPSREAVVSAPPEFQPVFDSAAKVFRDYFGRMEIDPARGMLGIDDERYVLIRASAFSIDFLDTVVHLYADRGEREALAIGRGFLFDIAHTIGLHDARALHAKLGSQSPIEKLSGGPVHFAYTGWALVDIKAESNPVPNDDFCLVYDHPYSFEAASFVRAGRGAEGPVCIMNAGYSSGWCQASFGVELTAVEVECRAKGDAACRFVMAPPHRVAERVREHFHVDLETFGAKGFGVPTYFERKRVEEDLRDSLSKLKQAQDELVRRERLATVGLLVSGLAHEVNTPLGIAVTAMAVVDDEHRALEKMFDEQRLTRGDLRRFFERAGQASSLVRANLDRAALLITKFKRVSVDHATHELRSVDLGRYLRETLESLQPVIRRGGLEIAFATDGNMTCTTHPGALAQIVTNFLTNSAAHGRGDAARLNVKLSVVRRSESQLSITYEDDGRGMTEEVRARAFQPFFTTARGEGGSGLGLHIVHSLVADVLRGRITLDTSPGKGVRFAVDVPVNSA